MKNGQKRNRNGGFTLVELIVVLVILAVLSAIAVPSFLGYIDNAKEKECQANMKALAAYLDEARVTNPETTMEAVIKAHEEEIKCPSGGRYDIGKADETTPASSLGVGEVFHCTVHGESETVGSESKLVTAKTGENTANDPNPHKPKEEPPVNPTEESSEDQTEGSEEESSEDLTEAPSENSTEDQTEDLSEGSTEDQTEGATEEYTVTLVYYEGRQETVSVAKGETYTLPTSAERSGYTFLGWFTAAEGGTQMTSMAINENVTFYAQWQKENVPVTKTENIHWERDQKYSLYVESEYYDWNNEDEVTWTISDPTIVQYDGPDRHEGKFTALKDGVCTIQAVIRSHPERTYIWNVTVYKTIEHCEMQIFYNNAYGKSPYHSVYSGDYFPVEVIYNPVDATVGPVNYSSSDTSIATVDSNGMVQVNKVDKETKVVISATIVLPYGQEQKTLTMEIYIKPRYPEKVSAVENPVHLYTNVEDQKAKQLQMRVDQPEPLQWVTFIQEGWYANEHENIDYNTNKNFVQVNSETGLVTALNVGTATVRGKYQVEYGTAEVAFTVIVDELDYSKDPLLDGKVFKGRSWEEFQQCVLDGEPGSEGKRDYKFNDYPDDPPLFCDPIIEDGKVVGQTLYVVVGHSRKFDSVKEQAQSCNSFAQFKEKIKDTSSKAYNQKITKVRLAPDEIVTISLSEVEAKKNDATAYDPGTVVKVEVAEGVYEYYVAYGSNTTYNAIKNIFDKSTLMKGDKNGWWKLEFAE